MKVGSVNCKIICKSNNIKHIDKPIQRLRQQNLIILLYQEANIYSFDKITRSLNIKFQAEQILWIMYCGIITIWN
jgi:hypothetical protein